VTGSLVGISGAYTTKLTMHLLEKLHKGSFQKTSIPPPRRKLEVNPPTAFGCPNTFIIIRNNFVSPPPPDGRNFLRGESVDLFWNDPKQFYGRISHGVGEGCDFSGMDFIFNQHNLINRLNI
jgi:hypothetical protein